MTGTVAADAAPQAAQKQGLGAAIGAAGAGKKKGGKGLLGGLLGRAFSDKKRVVGSRIIQRADAGKWI